MWVPDEEYDRIVEIGKRIGKRENRDVRGRVARRRDRVDYWFTFLLCFACLIAIVLGLLHLGHEIRMF